MKKRVDVRVEGKIGDSVFLLISISAKGKKWTENHLPADAIRLGSGIGVEHRFIGDIVAGMRSDGLKVHNELQTQEV